MRVRSGDRSGYEGILSPETGAGRERASIRNDGMIARPAMAGRSR